MGRMMKPAAIAMAMAVIVVVVAGSASATTLEVSQAKQNQTVSLTLSLASGTSLTVKNTSGSIQNTCTTSTVAGSTEPPYTGTKVGGTLSTLSFTNCTRTVTVHSKGSIYIEHIETKTDGRVYSGGAQITVGAPLVGYLNCFTHEGTHLGTLTGTASGHATLHVDAIVDCGISASWTGTYTVTSPTGLGVEP